MNKIRKIVSGLLALAMIFGMLMHPEIVRADEATVTFGSESYSTQTNDEFQVGVYIRGESQVGTYRIELEYDDRRLEYTGGAESEQNGIIVLQGTGIRDEVKYMLSFRTLSGGEAYIKVKNSVVNMGSVDNEEAFVITEEDFAVITVRGRDTVGDEPKPGFETDIPHIEPAILVGNTEMYMLDLRQQLPEEVTWNYSPAELTFMGQKTVFLSNADRSVYFAYLFDEAENFVCYAYNPSQSMFYPCEIYTSDSMTYWYTSPSACEQWPDELTLDIIKTQNIVYAVDANGIGGFSVVDEEGNMVEWDAEAGRADADSQNMKLLLILAIAFLVILLILIGTFLTSREIERKKRLQRKEMRRQAKEKMAEGVTVISLDQETRQMDVEAILKQEQSEKDAVKKKKRKPVISVRDVTMRFKIATSNVSGIKEYFIQLLKKEISYRELLALDHVSFDVYKGEVVGIIGTNGSGKSTLLRIVSGALEPTEGEVLVNRKKLQLLTLGTGFDGELTAKENVYLNGAIIGYTEEFINEHYDEIVAFAELEGFMEEKVKNFSSGMVSRLGFAIATVGEASEILILDEVLSVGDEFFRKKSLEKVKEMIHGGSTVLMVSHSMDSIIEHCTKVVWIEKGVLKMVGEPKVVCEAYRKIYEEKKTIKNGLVLENGTWYLYKDNQIHYTTTLVKNFHGWWYVRDGKIDLTYVGIASNQHGKWYVRNGKIDFFYIGDVESDGKVYKVVNGKVVGEQ